MLSRLADIIIVSGGIIFLSYFFANLMISAIEFIIASKKDDEEDTE